VILHHSNQSLVDLEAVGVRSHISEPDRGRRNWEKKREARVAVYRNRRRIRGPRGLRLRGERLERPFAHLYETGGMRRVHLRGHTNILKRLLTHTSGFNLGLLMRQLIGVGTPRGLQGLAQRGRDRASRADWGAQGTCYAASAADAGGLTAQGALDREIRRRAHRRARNGFHHGQLN
jgi:hypothetical protein